MLKDSILKFLKLEGFVNNLTGYLETRVELFKLEIREDIAKSVAKLSVYFVLTFSFIIFILFLSIAFALWIGESLGPIMGFVIMAGIYLVIAIVLLMLKDPISKNLEKKILEIVKKK
ncbi:MAG TPA: phage holin family protein [Cyclobacteriaceae bacterium]